MSSVGHTEREHGGCENPCRERYQAEEPVGELPEDECSGRGSGSKGPNCSYNEPGTLNAGSLLTAVGLQNLFPSY